ncbi:putative nitronate monooxygenase [Glarea lozoyensis 74030]|uniref:Putative nitronate monooxygenase n=1 Tax=Glarea lozoyensis (strain ATCC 74030 / MF5533) TaxID=1104152 RepID=H0EXA3_GLAL7|nr:putative nitronate monooxygenase [Glarea lozoyensis 74030]
MARTSGGPLAAAVSNAGGLGCIGGLGYTPVQLREIIHSLKSSLSSPDLPFGVDLALPKVGDGARKTNHDYTHGQLDELITVTIEEGARLFISAPEKIKELTEKGVVPIEYDMDQGIDVDIPHLMGVVAGVIQKIQPAKEIVDEMVSEAVDMLKQGHTFLSEKILKGADLRI